MIQEHREPSQGYIRQLMRQSERAHSLSRRGKQRRDKRRENARTQAVDKRNAACQSRRYRRSFAIDKAAVHSDGANKGVTSKSGANKKLPINLLPFRPSVLRYCQNGKTGRKRSNGHSQVEIRPREAVQMLTVPMQTATHEQKEVQVNVRPPKLRPMVLRVTGTNSPVGTEQDRSQSLPPTSQSRRKNPG